MFYALHAVANHNGGKFCALLESISTQKCHAIRNIDGFNATSLKSIPIYSFYAIWNSNGIEFTAVFESMPSYFCHFYFPIIVGYFFRYNNRAAITVITICFGGYIHLFFSIDIYWIVTVINRHTISILNCNVVCRCVCCQHTHEYAEQEY